MDKKSMDKIAVELMLIHEIQKSRKEQEDFQKKLYEKIIKKEKEERQLREKEKEREIAKFLERAALSPQSRKQRKPKNKVFV